MAPAVPVNKIVVAVDPAITSFDESAETGIVVAFRNEDDHIYVCGDESGRYSPDEWATKAIETAVQWNATHVVGEKNQGGDLVESNIRQALVSKQGDLPDIVVKQVHASRGKLMRAEPVAALFEQGRCHLLGVFPDLEDQMTTFSGLDQKERCDRLDAMVWAVTELMTLGRVEVF